MKIKILILAILPLLLVGCDIFDEGDTRKTYDGPTVLGFFPLQQEVPLGAGVAAVEVQLIGEQRDQALPVNFEVDGGSTAQAGVHYNVATASPVSIEAGTSTVNVVIQLIGGSLEAGEEVRLTLNLLGGGDGVEASANLASSTIFIRG